MADSPLLIKSKAFALDFIRICNEIKRNQKEIAEFLGTEQSYYAKYENRKRPLPIDRLKALCEYYHVSADYILGLSENLPYGHSVTKRKEKSNK